MKLLLTSAGIKNRSIRDALVDLLGKPIAESTALCIPTAIYAVPGGAGFAWKLISGRAASPLCELGWKSLGVLELTALPSIETEHWTAAVEESDALLVGGGDPRYLCYWIQQSGLVDFAMFPHLDHDAMPDHSMANAKRWAARLPVPGYAMDDETAIKVVGGTVEVVSEGHWELFNPSPKASEAG